VETQPTNTRIRILNIGPAFYQGMDLDPGSYHVEVSAEGYETEKLWVTLSAAEDKYLDINLKQASVVSSGYQDNKITNSLGMNFAYIRPGIFMMGRPSSESGRSSDEKQHRVTLTKGFYMQTTEVTQGQWRAIMGSNPSKFSTFGDDCPVEQISWNDAQEFIRKLNRKEGGSRYRLPTEAEWEYAARAGSTTRFCYGNDESRLSEYAWYRSNSGKKTHSVAQKTSNAWGLYDMHGNVWEWCQDWKGDYLSGSDTDPTGSFFGSYRVDRGGGWGNNARACRSANRYGSEPVYRYSDLGFRLAFSPGQ